jgi:GDP-mannose transporter
MKEVVTAIAAYSFCSGTMLILNKAGTMALPSGFLASLQFLFAVVAILVGHSFKVITVDPLTPTIVVPYLKYCVLFLLGVYSNMQSLAQSSVDTVIVFRSSTPLLVCLMDVLFMGRENPSLRSMLSMSAMVLGAFMYVSSDSQFKMEGLKAYFWVLSYFVIISLEMIFGKKITSSVKCSLATSVLLTNLFTLPAMLLLSKARGESWSLTPIIDNPAYFWVLTFSCLAGTGIGFSSWWCRSLLSATGFTVVGICNKVLTVILNIAVWDKHASPFGTFSLLVCLGGGVAYQQAPMKETGDSKNGNSFGGTVEEGVAMLVKEEIDEVRNEEGEKLYVDLYRRGRERQDTDVFLGGEREV